MVIVLYLTLLHLKGFLEHTHKICCWIRDTKEINVVFSIVMCCTSHANYVKAWYRDTKVKSEINIVLAYYVCKKATIWFTWIGCCHSDSSTGIKYNYVKVTYYECTYIVSPYMERNHIILFLAGYQGWIELSVHHSCFQPAGIILLHNEIHFETSRALELRIWSMIIQFMFIQLKL